jgi:hypothetical protein
MKWLASLIGGSTAAAPRVEPATTLEGIVADLTARIDRLKSLPPKPYTKGDLVVDQLRDWFALHVTTPDVYDPWRIPQDGPRENWPRLTQATSPQRLVDLASALVNTADGLDTDPRRMINVHALFMGPNMCRLSARSLFETAVELARRTGQSLSVPANLAQHLRDEDDELSRLMSNVRDGLYIASAAGR